MRGRGGAWCVSILSQPEGRELHSPQRGLLLPLVFQSSPSPKAGSYRPIRALGQLRATFQSSPSPKAGSYNRYSLLPFSHNCFNPLPARRPGATNRTTYNVTVEVFQSSPSPKAGSYVIASWTTKNESSFNPLPARRPGATVSLFKEYLEQYVSILSQPEGRELRCLVCFSPTFYGTVSILSQPEGRELRWQV